MTENEWMKCADPGPMLEYLRGKATERKLTLFSLALLSNLLFWMDEYGNAVEVAERFADGRATLDDLRRAEQMVLSESLATSSSWDHDAFVSACMPGNCKVNGIFGILALADRQHRLAAKSANDPARYAAIGVARKQRQVAYLRDIFDNPFRPVPTNPAWLNSTVKQLAEAIYEDRAFDPFPILADSLEDSGCTNAEVLNHCRQAGEHVRGCWCFDSVLGRE